MSGAVRLVAAGMLLVAAAALAPAPPPGAPAAEPLARALAPLGPVKAFVSSALWFGYLRESDRAAADLAETLIALHPELDSVRTFLAHQLVVTEASRAPDRRRHELLVLRGLRLLEDGLETRDSDRLRSALARLLVIRRERDPLLGPLVEEHFGCSPEELAIEQLRAVESDPDDAELLARLLLERALRRYDTTGDAWTARRDADEAAAVLRARAGYGDEEIDALLAPVRERLERAPPPRAPPPHELEDGPDASEDESL